MLADIGLQDGIAAFSLPDSVKIAPLGHNERRLRREDGIFIDDGQGLIKAFGMVVLGQQWPMLNLTCDRGNINCAAIHYAQNEGLLITVNWDFCHGMWNAIKHAAKVAQKGRAWRAILEFLACFNMNHGPFRSGQWFRAKQEWLQQYMGCHDHTSPDFLRAAGGIAKDLLDLSQQQLSVRSPSRIMAQNVSKYGWSVCQHSSVCLYALAASWWGMLVSLSGPNRDMATPLLRTP